MSNNIKELINNMDKNYLFSFSEFDVKKDKEHDLVKLLQDLKVWVHKNEPGTLLYELSKEEFNQNDKNDKIIYRLVIVFKDVKG